MISVIVKLTGSRPQLATVEEGSTVQTVLEELNLEDGSYNILLNSEPANTSTIVSDEQTIVLTERVKGGLN